MRMPFQFLQHGRLEIWADILHKIKLEIKCGIRQLAAKHINHCKSDQWQYEIGALATYKVHEFFQLV